MWERRESFKAEEVFAPAEEVVGGAGHFSPAMSREAIIEQSPPERKEAYSPMEIIIKTPGSPDKPGLLVEPDLLIQAHSPTPKSGRRFHEYLGGGDIILPVNE